MNGLPEALASLASKKVEAVKIRFREETRPRIADLLARQAATRIRKAQGQDTTTSDIAQAAELSNIGVEERAFIAAQESDLALEAVLKIVGAVL